jgi:hypothetical protein
MSFKWKEDKHKAFEDLKEKLSFAPTLKFSDFTKLFEVHTNTSDFTIGTVFVQDGTPNCFQEQKTLWNIVVMVDS